MKKLLLIFLLLFISGCEKLIKCKVTVTKNVFTDSMSPNDVSVYEENKFFIINDIKKKFYSLDDVKKELNTNLFTKDIIKHEIQEPFFQYYLTLNRNSHEINTESYSHFHYPSSFSTNSETPTEIQYLKSGSCKKISSKKL